MHSYDHVHCILKLGDFACLLPYCYFHFASADSCCIWWLQGVSSCCFPIGVSLPMPAASNNSEAFVLIWLVPNNADTLSHLRQIHISLSQPNSCDLSSSNPTVRHGPCWWTLWWSSCFVSTRCSCCRSSSWWAVVVKMIRNCYSGVDSMVKLAYQSPFVVLSCGCCGMLLFVYLCFLPSPIPNPLNWVGSCVVSCC